MVPPPRTQPVLIARIIVIFGCLVCVPVIAHGAVVKGPSATKGDNASYRPIRDREYLSLAALRSSAQGQSASPVGAQKKAPPSDNPANAQKAAPAAGKKQAAAAANSETPEQKSPVAPSANAEKKPAKPQNPTLPALLVVGDFSSLLSSDKMATSAELKQLVAFISTDKGHSFPATLEQLAPGFALVRNPSLSGEVAASLLVGSVTAGRAPVQVEISSTNVQQNIVISGDFSEIVNDSSVSQCSPMDACAILLAADGQSMIGKVTGLRLSSSEASVTYTAPIAPSPSYVRIGRTRLPSLTFPFIAKKPTESATQELVQIRQVVSGDFCRKGPTGDCTTDLL
jgi:hypothetical protein